MSERILPAWATAKGEEVLWLDDDHAVVWLSKTDAQFWHRKDGSEEWCVGGFKIGEQWWQIEQEDPLTLSPSLRCGCGHHGWIRNNIWVEA